MGTIEPILPDPIGAALFSVTRQAVLRLLFGHAGERFYQRQIIRIVGLGSGAVQRDLAQLTRAGILVRTVEGRQTYYQANRACPVFDELHGLIRKTFGVAQVLKDGLAALAGKIQFAFIYGSLATGGETATSDVDVMVVGERISLQDVVSALTEAQRELRREVNPSVYRTEEFCRKLAGGHHFSPIRKIFGPATTMKVSLQDWLKFGWLKEHKTSRQEIADLLAVADRDLEACRRHPKTRPDESGRGRVRLCATWALPVCL